METDTCLGSPQKEKANHPGPMSLPFKTLIILVKGRGVYYTLTLLETVALCVSSDLRFRCRADQGSRFDDIEAGREGGQVG